MSSPEMPSSSATSHAPSRLTVRRDHPDDVRQRQIYARVDDGDSVPLRFGQQATFEIEPGAHALKANNTLYWKTVPFSVGPGEHAEFVVVNRLSRFGFGALSLLGVGPLRLTVERVNASQPSPDLTS